MIAGLPCVAPDPCPECGGVLVVDEVLIPVDAAAVRHYAKRASLYKQIAKHRARVGVAALCSGCEFAIEIVQALA